MAYAFRCRNCNSLEEAGQAGEAARPAACRVCGAGVSWTIENGVPVKTLDPDNWIVLADLPKAELAPILEEHAIDANEIEAHQPFATDWQREDDATEEVTHACPVCELLPDLVHVQGAEEPALKTRPVHDCDVCAAHRPGTRDHEEGRVDTVTIPVWSEKRRDISVPEPAREPQVIAVEAREGLRGKDKSR